MNRSVTVLTVVLALTAITFGQGRPAATAPITSTTAAKHPMASAATTTQPATSIAGIAALIKQLGNEEWNDRDDAQKQLIAIGWPALGALREARRNGDAELADRATRAIEEIYCGLEARRTELRGKTDEGYFSVSKANYLALLALPEPPLCDCFAATYVFRQQMDWPALATALEVAGESLRRVMAAPYKEFVRETTDRPPANGLRAIPQPWQTHGSYVYVQAGFDGTWRLEQGTVKNWLPVLKETQQSMKRDCAGVYWELGGLYRDKLGRPEDALWAYRQALEQHPLYTEPLDTLVPKVWPKAKIDKEVLWPTSVSMGPSRTDWSTRDALTDLADAQEQTGDIRGALETRIRVMLAVRLEQRTWDNYRKEPHKVWVLVKTLPPQSPLPTLPAANGAKTAKDFLGRFASEEAWVAALTSLPTSSPATQPVGALP